MDSFRSEMTDEIQDRLQKRYLDRLAQRVRRMRKHVAGRSWEQFDHECEQLANGAEGFGFGRLVELSEAARRLLPLKPSGGASARTMASTEARRSIETLFAAIDDILVAHEIHRP